MNNEDLKDPKCWNCGSEQIHGRTAEGDWSCGENGRCNDIQKGDVIRGRRLGNKHPGNYVVDSLPSRQSEYLPAGTVSVIAHREYSGARGRLMLIEDPRVIRTYRDEVDA